MGKYRYANTDGRSMRPFGRATALAVAATAGTLVLTGCGGGGRRDNTPASLHVTTTTSVAQGPILVRHITYTTFDGARIPALFSIPQAVPPRGREVRGRWQRARSPPAWSSARCSS